MHAPLAVDVHHKRNFELSYAFSNQVQSGVI